MSFACFEKGNTIEPMSYPLRALAYSGLVFTFFLILGCGSGRHLESVTISPQTADAQDFPNGEVPFSATGIFSKPPSPFTLTSKDVTWCVGTNTGACDGLINPGATVDQNGVAKCFPGFSVTLTILAGKMRPSGK